MFEWFFGHPEKRAESDYVKFKKKVQDAITDFNDKKFEECKDKFEEALLFLDDLQNKIEKIIDKEESVIEKIKSFEERVRNEILKNNMNLDTIYQIIESSKDNLFKEIDDSKEIIGLIVEGMGDQKEFNEFSNEIIASIDKIKKDLDQIIVYYDFLEFIHLEPEEVEFYIRKGRIGSVIKDEMEIAKFFNKNIIGTNFVYKINKDIKSVQIQDFETGHGWDEHVALIKGKTVPVGSGNNRESQFNPGKSIDNVNEIELEIIYDLNNITVVSQNALTFEKTFPGVGLCYPHGLNDPQTANRVKLFFYLSPPDRAGHFHSFPTLF